jgi:hypothetical protein
VKVVLGTITLLLAFAVALFGFAVSQGERDILSFFLTMSVVLAVSAFGLFGWSAVTWYQRTKLSATTGETTAPVPVSAPLSTVLLVFGVVLAFVGLPMLIDGVHRLTRSGEYGSKRGQEFLSSGYPAAEWPWFFAFGLVLIASALVWKLHLRRTRGARSTSA